MMNTRIQEAFIDILRQRPEQREQKSSLILPNRWSSESHQACLNGRVVIEVGEANATDEGNKPNGYY